MNKYFLFILSLFILSSCSSYEDAMETPTNKYKVAVLMHKSELGRWERTAKWAQENIAEAQLGMTSKVQLELTFKDQDAEDIAEYMQQIAEDTTVIAIVGPTTSQRAEQMAIQLGISKAVKPMITPSATWVQYQRKFAYTPYVWNLAESDITEIEVILSEIASLHSANELTVELLAPDDDTGEVQSDYVEWFSFIAEEYGLKVSAIHFYKNTTDLRNSVREVCGPNPENRRKILVFCPGVEDDAIAFDREVGTYRDEVEKRHEPFYTPRKMYCSDGFVSNIIASTVKNMDYEGVDLYASPESGFIQAYHQRYGQDLVNGEAQFYDALCMLAYAATLQLHLNALNQKPESLNDALLAVVDGRDGTGCSWLPADMAYNFQLLAQGHTPDIDGVSSNWQFDKKTHSSVVSSTYRRWRIFEGKYVTTEYVSTEGSRRSSSTKTMWDWTASKFQTFSAEGGDHITYPTLDDRWALLVAASKGWPNYRFQADVFAMYQLLRQHGYDDDHIVLICEDDVARNPNNPYQGELRVSDTGVNVYASSAIDYCLNTLTPDDIGDILQGRCSDCLPKVISADENDNVLVFWSSHGSIGSMDFGGTQSMTYQKMKNILAATPHRKLLFAIEACYSGGLGEYCQGLPGMLFITAATPYETSHADVWSETLSVYLSNGFTRGFQEAIDESPAISLRDLYYSLARHTIGSHVKMYNDANYGSVYNETMDEYLH